MMRGTHKKKGVDATPALGTPEEVSYFFLAFFAVVFFLAMLFASSLSGVRAVLAGPFSANRKLEMFHGFLSLFRSPARLSASSCAQPASRSPAPRKG